MSKRTVRPQNPDIKRSSEDEAAFEELIALTRKRPMTKEEILVELDIKPSQLDKIIELAQLRHFRVQVDGRISLPPSSPSMEIQDLEIAPVTNGYKMGVISDLHFGSKYHLNKPLQDSVEWLYDNGVREILCPGDVLEGCYRHARYELTHHGLSEQTEAAFEGLPKKKGLRYWSITGNHDETFAKEIGVDVGSHIQDYFEKHGRKDLRFIGDRGAYVRIGGVTVELWHPLGGKSYARSYRIQKHVEDYGPGKKPKIMLAGHWHMYCHVDPRGVNAFACPTFQGGGGPFGKALGGDPSIGCLLIDWKLTNHGTIRSLRHEKRTYFEVERPVKIDSDMDAAIQVE